MTIVRRSLLGVAACATLSLAAPAFALYSGTALVNSQVPDWAVGNDNCAGTLITPRVMLTIAQCTDPGLNTGFYMRWTARIFWGKTVTYPSAVGPVGNIGLVMSDTPISGLTAPIASYAEERLALRDGDYNQTTGTPLVIYAKDSVSGNFATAARTADTYTGKWRNSSYLDGKKIFYRSVSNFRNTQPARITGSVSDNIFNDGVREALFTDSAGLRLSDRDADDMLVLTAPPVDDIPSRAPFYPGDQGGGIFFRRPDGGLRLINLVSGAHAHTRLSSMWPWTVNALVARGLREDALNLSRKVLGTPAWGAQNRTGEIGQIFAYDNPYSRRLEFFRLASLGADRRYVSFPINQRDNENWEYLGTQLPDIEQATTPVKEWGSNDRRGSAGDLFIYNNPYSRRVEYFRLAALGGDGRYGYFPINQKGNAFWQYLGTDLPSRPVKIPGKR